MKEPARLERSGRPLVRTLMQLGRDEAPSARVFERTLGALGVAAPTASMLGVSLAARAAAMASSSTVSKTAASAGVGLVAKWLGAGVVAGVVVSGTAVSLDRFGSDERVPRAAPAARSASAPSREFAQTPARSLPPAVPSTPDLSPPRAPVAEPLAEPESALSHEVAAIDKARTALGRGDARAALKELDRYDRDVHAGHLGAEAMYLRMEALSLQGDHAQAANAARRLLSAYPDGPHAARAKALVGMPER
jgi:hypothetical protein